jgi:hypothetical protein
MFCMALEEEFICLAVTNDMISRPVVTTYASFTL